MWMEGHHEEPLVPEGGNHALPLVPEKLRVFGAESLPADRKGKSAQDNPVEARNNVQENPISEHSSFHGPSARILESETRVLVF